MKHEADEQVERGEGREPLAPAGDVAQALDARRVDGDWERDEVEDGHDGGEPGRVGQGQSDEELQHLEYGPELLDADLVRAT